MRSVCNIKFMTRLALFALLFCALSHGQAPATKESTTHPVTGRQFAGGDTIDDLLVQLHEKRAAIAFR